MTWRADDLKIEKILEDKEHFDPRDLYERAGKEASQAPESTPTVALWDALAEESDNNPTERYPMWVEQEMRHRGLWIPHDYKRWKKMLTRGIEPVD